MVSNYVLNNRASFFFIELVSVNPKAIWSPNLLIDESQIATLVQALEPDVQRLRDYCSQFQFIGELDDLIDRIPAQTPEKLEDYRARTAEYPPEVYARWLVELVKRQALETVASIP